ncbi:hypothetical protein HpDR14_12190 [Helicobacter pylori]
MEILKNLLNEYKRINEKRLKTLFLFNRCLSACFLAVGCYLIYQWKQKDFFNDGLDLIQIVSTLIENHGALK